MWTHSLSWSWDSSSTVLWVLNTATNGMSGPERVTGQKNKKISAKKLSIREIWPAVGCCPTLTVEQEVAHVEAEGAADVAAAVGQRTRQAAAVEGAEGVGAAETRKRRNDHEVPLFSKWRLGATTTCTGVSSLDRPRC